MLWKLPLLQHVILQVAMSIHESFLNTRRLYVCKDWACWLAVKRYMANQTQCIVIEEEELKLTNTVLLLQASVTRFNFQWFEIFQIYLQQFIQSVVVFSEQSICILSSCLMYFHTIANIKCTAFYCSLPKDPNPSW